MSYQVLARKWRPRSFREMVGQEHVLKALINALDHNRLHHAYLFTGTRGVGKTTIARILARCLNCEVGVSSEPCGKCSSCMEINEGRFVDLIEVDAASRTKVEDTRELLDNVQYAPTRGRYKIYLIDEVHMLSNHSFNALLKTLEEPPAHVKFLLATTDPQKLPVTVLSRCLQFNLKNMSPERIVQHLQVVLREEMVPFDDGSLWQLARSADGSMRDALSLTDQAIAFGSGKVADADVTAMLGTIDHKLIGRLVAALAASNGAELLTAVAQFADQAPDYHSALGDLVTLLHRIAIAQALPDALDNSFGDREQILRFAQSLAPEDVQLFYQTGLIGRRDLHLAPEPRAGFEMTLLRMLAFKPQGVADVPSRSLPSGQNDTPAVPESSAPSQQAAPPPSVSPTSAAEVPPVSSQHPQGSLEQEQGAATQEADGAKKCESEPGAALLAEPVVDVELPADTGSPPGDERRTVAEELASVAGLTTAAQLRPARALQAKPAAKEEGVVEQAVEQTVPAQVKATCVLADFDAPQWIAVYGQLAVRGVLQSTASNCVLVGRQQNQLYFALDQDKASLFDESHRRRLGDLLSDYFNEPVQVHIDLQALPEGVETPAMHHLREREEAKAAAIARLQGDPIIQFLEHEFDAQLDPESVFFN